MNTKEHSNYIDIFFPHGMTLDREIKNDYLSKYDDFKKSELLSHILKKYSLKNESFVNKMKKILPNGLSYDYIITDKEYENLKMEFNIE